MKRVVALFAVVSLITLLAGCGGFGADTPKDASDIPAVTETQIPIEEENESDRDGLIGDLFEADDQNIPEKCADPNDDPRMIVQVNWKSGRYAFIDRYNLIGYAHGSPDPISGATYYLEENYEYIPKSRDYKPFYTPATGESGYKVSDGDAFVDLERWAYSYNIDASEMSVDGTTFIFENASGKKFSVSRDYYTYSAPGEDGRNVFWDFHPKYNGNHGAPIYGAVFGEKHQLSNDIKVMWAIEQGLKAFANDYFGNPW